MSVAKSIILCTVIATCLYFALNFLAWRAAIDYHLAVNIGRLQSPLIGLGPEPLRFLLVFVPTAIGTVAAYGWFRNGPFRFSRWALLACITAVAVPIALTIGNPYESEQVRRSRATAAPIRATMVGIYMVVLGCIFAWVVMRQRRSTKMKGRQPLP